MADALGPRHVERRADRRRARVLAGVGDAVKALLRRLAEVRAEGLVVVDRLASEDRKTKATAEMLRRLGATGKTLLIDVQPDEGFSLSARNLAGVKVVQSSRVTARDVMDTTRVVATKEALEKLQETLG